MLGRLLLATRDLLRTTFADPTVPSYHPEVIRIGTDSSRRPPAFVGERCITIYGLSWRPGPSPDQDLGLDEVYSVGIMLHFRSRVVPFDQQGEELYIKETLGMEAVSRRIISVIHKNTAELLVSANEDVTTGDPICEPFRWIGSDPLPREVDSTWFHESRNTAPMRGAGLVLENRFGGARRLSRFTDMYGP